ncbi:hypothetical protein BKA69DRAFT_1171746 [Paraphysoderma sedebokerense]|nr:hypothetical protein BKA69DRAFT_1171746 [Paraphysoderma sedebokerense]
MRRLGRLFTATHSLTRSIVALSHNAPIRTIDSSIVRPSLSPDSAENSTDDNTHTKANNSIEFTKIVKELTPAFGLFTVLITGLTFVNSMITTNNENMKNYSESLEKVEAKLEGKIVQSKKELEVKLDKLEAKMEGKLDRLEAKMEGKLDRLEAKMEKKLDTLGAKLDKLGERRGWLW